MKRAAFVAAVLLASTAAPYATHLQAQSSLRVLSSNGVKAVIEDLRARIERSIGQPLSLEFSTAASLAREIDTGKPFDVAILTPALIESLIASDRIAAESYVEFARAGIGVGARAGTGRRDVGTPAALRATLLAVESVAFTTGGQSRAAIDAAFERLGITEQMQAKTLLLGPGEAPSAVAAGRAELVLTLVSEILPEPGLELVGPLPDELQSYVSFAAARSAIARDVRAADALLRYLAGAELAAALAAHGMEPLAGAAGDALWFEGGRLLVGDGTDPIENAAFLVEGDSFTWVGAAGERDAPAGVMRVDLAGKTVIPALIDGHNHIGLTDVRHGTSSKANYTRANLVDHLQRYAYYGVGAALSMGLEADQTLAYRLRDEVLSDAALFLTAGKGIAATPVAGPPTEARLGIPYGAANEEEGRRRVRELSAQGVHFVKIWVDDRGGTVPKLEPVVYRAIIDEAHALGMAVLAHVGRTSGLEDAKDLYRAGVDGFVHLVRDRDVDEEYLTLVRAHPDVWTGPNLPDSILSRDDLASLSETLPAEQIASMREGIERREAEGRTEPSDLFELHCRNLRRIREAGVTLGLGTDGTGDAFGVHQEMADYTKCGLTAHEALVAATGTNARVLGLERMGTVEAGKSADFVILDANPIDDITNTRRISDVYLRGDKVDRAALRERWTGGR